MRQIKLKTSDEKRRYQEEDFLVFDDKGRIGIRIGGTYQPPKPKKKTSSPKICALITASGGIGSHFVLHKLQGHPNIVVLNESSFTIDAGLVSIGSTKTDLKSYLGNRKFESISSEVELEQLYPMKELKNYDISCIILNKPPLKRMNYHRVYNKDISVNYIFRNPVSFYYTWIKKWKEYGNRYHSRNATQEDVFEWFKNTFMTSLFELAQNFDSERDNIVSFEHFFNDCDAELSRIYKTLGVREVKSNDLIEMDYCPKCGTRDLEIRKIAVREGRTEDVLYCPDHGEILGPGEHNYIRKESGEFINKWKNKPDCREMCEKFSVLFGEDLIQYYYDEKYLVDKDRKIYDSLIANFLNNLKVGV